MGCGTSTDSVNTGNVSPQPSDYYIDRATPIGRNNLITHQSALETFLRLDEEINELEKLCPGPRLATVEAWIRYLESKQTLSNNDVIQMPLHMLDEEYNEEDDVAKYSRRTRSENDIESLTKVRQLAEKLNVVSDATQAARYEEFLANISRRYIENCTEVLIEEILEHAQKRSNELRESWTRLRSKYNEQDAVIASVTNNDYVNPNEVKLDAELESARQIREKLGGTAEQWRISANLLSTSAKSALVASELYGLIKTSKSMTEKIKLATDCRSALLGSIIAFRCGQEALPQVEIPCTTNRQIVAISHANEYLLTDIANVERYQHTNAILEAYKKSVSDSVAWLNDVFQRTLRKDLQEAEEAVVTLSKKLRQLRSDYIRSKIGYPIQSSENHVNVNSIK